VNGVRVAHVWLALSAVLVALIAAPVAGAQIVVGQTAPAGVSPFECKPELSYDEVQTATAAGTSYVIPITGAITSWSTISGPWPNQAFTLKVFRQTGPLSYLVVDRDVRFPLPGLNTFTEPFGIQVQAGDIIGSNVSGGFTSPCSFETGLPGDQIRFAQGIGSPGKVVSFSPGNVEAGSRINISATVLPPPAITSISPAKGSIKGARVIVTGANFAGVKTVKFGASSAKNYVVETESQLTATAPSSAKLTKVQIEITTVAGTVVSTQTFAYQGCKVPQLNGLTLKAAKRKSRKAKCKVGAVTKRNGATSQTGHVVKQHPNPGRVLAPGSKVNVTLGA
jgi:PASTA domain/IPT/TIG domain